MAPRLCWLGLGNMGSGMCKNIIEKGSFDGPLLIYNRTQQRADDFCKTHDKCQVAPAIKDAVSKSDIILTCVGDDKAVESTISTALEGDVQGKLFVDCSTIHPNTTEKIARIVTEKGAEFVACPVFGAPAMAESGQLVCVIAGPASGVDKMLPFTKGVIARENIDFRDQSPQQATLLKVIGNSFILNMVEMLAEGHVLAEKSGLGVANLQQFITAMLPVPYTAYSQRMSSGDYYQRERPLFAVDLAIKDANHALEVAESSGSKMRAIEVAADHLKDVKQAKGEKGDLAGVYGAVRVESGLPYEA